MVEALIVLMLFFPTMCGTHWLCVRFSAKNDPVYRCKVYLDKEGGSCAHVDGPLCNFDTCSTRLAIEDPSGRNILSNGLILLQESPPRAVRLGSGPDWGWLHAQTKFDWKPIRMLEPWEIMQAEDQRDRGIILSGRERRWK